MAQSGGDGASTRLVGFRVGGQHLIADFDDDPLCREAAAKALTATK